MTEQLQPYTLVFEVEEAPLLLEGGRLNLERIDQIAMLLSDILNSGIQVILVTAGAIASGCEKLKLKNMPTGLDQKQAVAAIGQVELIKIYQQSFDMYNQQIAQVLLARDISSSEKRITNAKNTFYKLLEMQVIPVINENDTVSTEDILYENNYPLTASVANLVHADLVILFENGNKFRIYNPVSEYFWRAKSTEELIYIIKDYKKNLRQIRDKVHYPLTTDKLKQLQEKAYEI